MLPNCYPAKFPANSKTDRDFKHDYSYLRSSPYRKLSSKLRTLLTQANLNLLQICEITRSLLNLLMVRRATIQLI